MTTLDYDEGSRAALSEVSGVTVGRAANRSRPLSIYAATVCRRISTASRRMRRAAAPPKGRRSRGTTSTAVAFRGRPFALCARSRCPIGRPAVSRRDCRPTGLRGINCPITVLLQRKEVCLARPRKSGNEAVAAKGRERTATAVSCGSLIRTSTASLSDGIFICTAAPNGPPRVGPAFRPAFCQRSAASSPPFVGNARPAAEGPANREHGIAATALIFTKRGRRDAGGHCGCSCCLTAKRRKSKATNEKFFSFLFLLNDA